VTPATSEAPDSAIDGSIPDETGVVPALTSVSESGDIDIDEGVLEEDEARAVHNTTSNRLRYKRDSPSNYIQNKQRSKRHGAVGDAELEDDETRDRAKSWDGVTSRYTERRLREAAGDLFSRQGDITLEAVEHLQLLLEVERCRIMRQSKKPTRKVRVKHKHTSATRTTKKLPGTDGTDTAGTGGSGTRFSKGRSDSLDDELMELELGNTNKVYSVGIDPDYGYDHNFDTDEDEELQSISDSISHLREDEEASVGGERTSPGSGAVVEDTGARAPGSAMFMSELRSPAKAQRGSSRHRTEGVSSPVKMMHPSSPGGLSFGATLKNGDIPRLNLAAVRRKPVPSTDSPPSPVHSHDPSHFSDAR